METLSIFPQLLSYPLLAHTVLRLLLAYQFGKVAIDRRKKKYSFLVYVELIIVILLIIGLYTQLALLASIIFLIVEKILDKKDGVEIKDKELRLTLILIAFSLLFLGPGVLSIDMPL